MITSDPKIQIHRIKLTLLWHQNLMDSAAAAKPEAIDLGGYQQLFNTGRKNQIGPLTVPWPPHEQQRYWERYLKHWRSLPAVTAREARHALLPLRVSKPIALEAAEEDVSVGTEGYLHPWGATFVVTLGIAGEWPSLEAAADRVVELRWEKRFDLTGGPGALSLEDAANHGLAVLRSLAPHASEGMRWDPFSICTLLSASGEMEQFDPADENTKAARFLQAVTAFSPNWKLDELRPAAETKVAGISDAPTSHLVFGIKRGRAIWSPANFLLSSRAPSTVSCHHRNLVLASMQTEAIARFVEDTAARLGTGTTLSNDHMTQARWAVRVLEDIYKGSPDTYRSGSLKAQIAQNQLLDPINAVRNAHSLPAIA